MCRSITARVPTEEGDIHDDFKPKFKAEAEPRSTPSTTEQIKQDLSQHDVFLYMKVRAKSDHSEGCMLKESLCSPCLAKWNEHISSRQLSR